MTGELTDHAAAARLLLASVGNQRIVARQDVDPTFTTAMLAHAELDLKAAHVHAMLAVAEQQRIGNALQVALVDQLAAIAPYLTPMGAQVDPSIRIRDYLDEDQWALIGKGL